MHAESPAFDEQDLYGFVHEVIEYEKQRPIDGLSPAERLERASERLAAAVARIGVRADEADGGQWSPREILAHIALVSQVFGWAAWAVGEGEQTTIDVLSFLRLRDLAGSGFSGLTVGELLAIARSEHDSTVAYLRGAGRVALDRRANVYPFPMGPEQIVQFHVCGHVEMHVEQLERAIGLGTDGDWAAA
jgi:hypothetical protein